MQDIVFHDYGTFTDGEIEVFVQETIPADDEHGQVPMYRFGIRPAGTDIVVGRVNLRIASTEDILMYAGHIGYRVEEPYRGHRYAAKACRLIRPVALDHGLETVWLTVNPDNCPSRRTCEELGCTLVEIVNIPEDNDQYLDGERQKCRYRWDIGDTKM
jgi:tagatose 1,6-diphosphate aldolase